MFRAIWSKTLRDYRVAILGWGIATGLLMTIGLATATPAVTATFVSLASLLRFLGDAYAVQTPTGYVTFRYLGTFLPLMLSLWPILAGARMVRGEEENSTLDVLLSTPQPRARLLLEKIVALALALLLIALLFALGIVVGEARLQQVDVLRAVLTGLNLSLLAFFFGMVALLLSQLTTSRRAAAGGASGLLILSLLLTISGRELNGSWVQYLSPFYYYNLNRPLLVGFPGSPWAVLLLVALSILCAALSLVLFVRRDIGRPLFSWQRKTANAERSLSRAEHALSTRSIGLHTLSALGWSSFWWLFGIVLFCVYCLLLVPGVQKAVYKLVQETPWLAQYFFDTPTNTNAALLGTILFAFVPTLVVIFALVLALSWSADLENGRLELVFSTPRSRSRVLLERFAVNVLLVLLAPILTWLVITLGALFLNLNVHQGRVLAASFSMLPPALVTLGLIYALAGRLRYTPVLVILTAYLVLAFLEENLEGNIQFPSWILSLSIFHLYGNPIFAGMNWSNFLGMTGVAVVLLIVGVVQFRAADIQLG